VTSDSALEKNRNMDFLLIETDIASSLCNKTKKENDYGTAEKTYNY
jgi:hypothetical protein